VLLGQRGMTLQDRAFALGSGLLDPAAQRRITDIERGARLGNAVALIQHQAGRFELELG